MYRDDFHDFDGNLTNVWDFAFCILTYILGNIGGKEVSVFYSRSLSL